MSLIREDAALLRNLQHRRVADLISTNIPDEEAKLLKNGRLTCLICYHRPIFDTLAMLSVHRKGKKHILELSKHLLQKRELERRKLKKDHQTYLLTKSLPKDDASMMLGSKGSLMSSVPYSSCAKRQNKGQNRKRVLDVVADAEMYGTSSDEPLPSATSDVRHYLKNLRHKKPMKQRIEENRANYPTSAPFLPTPPEIPAPTTVTSALGQPVASEQAKHDLKLRMSGWIKDKSGSWIKDPDVEFDSDEDELPQDPPR